MPTRDGRGVGAREFALPVRIPEAAQALEIEDAHLSGRKSPLLQKPLGLSAERIGVVSSV